MAEAGADIPDTGALPAETIRRKRDGAALEAREIEDFVVGLARGTVSGEQASAFAMAVFFRGMTAAETTALTRGMVRSGTTLDWRGSALPGPVLDKHSTGGVGDTVSLMLAPALAACGAFVPMISGRGLGHSGGTLDKLEAIPGYRALPGVAELQRVVKGVGCAIVGATDDLAPADRRLYAIRDVTATVESIPLITASILSKKIAAGLDGLVMDVKAGSGAFMTRVEDAKDLARSIARVAGGAGLSTVAFVTDMDEPLASAAGNAVEVRHALDYLTGAAREERLHAVVRALGGALLRLGGLAATEAEGLARIEAAVASGAAAERFAAMVRALGGPGDLLDKPGRLPAAPVVRDIPARKSGFVTAIDTRAVGLAVVTLGGGRTRPGDTIDPRVGFTGLAPLGTRVGAGAVPLGTVHASSAADAETAAAALLASVRVGDAPPPQRHPVLDRVDAGDAAP